MKIALVGCTANPRVGGMGRALYDHATVLAEAGQEVTVYTLPPFPDNAPFTIRPIKYFLCIGKAAWRARFDPPLDAYDVVHLHLPFFGVAETLSYCKATQGHHPLEERIGARAGMVSERSEDERERDTTSARLAGANDSCLRQGVCPESRLVATYHMDAIGTGLKRMYFNWWYRHRFKKVLAACDAIAVTSHTYARESHLAKAGINVGQCEEMLLRVDTEKFNVDVISARKEPYFLFVGALDTAHYFKGISVLLRALAETRNAKLVIVGKGNLQSAYEKEAQKLNIAGCVTFTGGVTDEELARWYAGARALVLPSTDGSEAFGMVLIEAMACGTPVIASDLHGVRAVVERVSESLMNRAGGLLVPPGDEQALARTLKNAWDTPWSLEDRAALAACAAATYSQKGLAKQLISWYTGTRG